MGLFRKKFDDPVRGTAKVVSATGAKANAAYTPLDMTLVVQAEGIAPTSVQFHQRAARTKKFPFPGQEIPVEFDRSDPTRVRVLWDEVPTQSEVLRGQGDAVAAAMRSGPVTPGAGASPPPADRIAALERLASLRDSGVLTDEEFEREKSRVLGAG